MSKDNTYVFFFLFFRFGIPPRNFFHKDETERLSLPCVLYKHPVNGAWPIRSAAEGEGELLTPLIVRHERAHSYLH